MAIPVVLRIVALVIAATVVAGVKLNRESDVYSFEEYVQAFQKTYADADEHAMRKAIFERKAAAVAAHNMAADRGSVTWYEAINTFSDRTESELAEVKGYDRALGYHRINEHSRLCNGMENCARLSTAEGDRYLPVFSVLKKSTARRDNMTLMDWRNEGVLTAVKDQGHCGSCWSFAAVEALEAAYAISDDGYLMNLSEQQVLDCTPNPHQCGGTGGCEGGIAEIAYDMVQSLGGLAGEWIYPYVSYMGKDSKCRFEQSMLSAASSFMGNMSYVKLPTNKYDPLMAAVEKGPVAVSVDASAWSSYSGGVFDGCNQDSPVIDHGVVLVGYGTDPELGDYWIIRNSWGAEWGENGFMRLRRTASEGSRCGIDKSPSEGIACKGDPPTQKVCGTCGILLDPVLPLVQ